MKSLQKHHVVAHLPNIDDCWAFMLPVFMDRGLGCVFDKWFAWNEFGDMDELMMILYNDEMGK